MKKPTNYEDLPGESQLKKAKGASFFTSIGEQSNIDRLIPSTSKLTRRLDSLARLLEGSMICAAVYLDPNSTLYVTTNGIHLTQRNFPDNLKTRYLKDIFIHFMSNEFINSQLNHITPKDVEILIKIYNSKLSADFRGDIKTMPSVSDEVLRKILIFFSTNIDNSLRILSDEILSRFLDQSELIIFNTLDSASIKLLTHLQKRLSDLRQAYIRLWGHFKDYLKFKNIIISREIVIKDYSIVAIGIDNEHAELRMLSFILTKYHLFSDSRPFADKQYIGIAKLCYPNCICVVRSINACLNVNTNESKGVNTEISTVFDSDNANPSIGEIGSFCEDDVLNQSINIEAQEVVQSELLVDADESNINVRGSHDLVVSKWVKPTFLLGEKFLSSDNYLVWSASRYNQNQESQNAGWEKYSSSPINEVELLKLKSLTQVYAETESSIEQIRQKAIDEVRTNMYASQSSSEVQASPPSIQTGEPVQEDPLEFLLGSKK